MEENQYVKNLRFIDSLPYVGNWELDTVIIFFVPLIIGVLFGGKSIFIGILLGIIFSSINEKRKKNLYRGFYRNFTYSNGLYKAKTNRLPKAYERYFCG